MIGVIGETAVMLLILPIRSHMTKLLNIAILLICIAGTDRSQSSALAQGIGLVPEIRALIEGSSGLIDGEQVQLLELRTIYQAREFRPLWRDDAAAERHAAHLYAALVGAGERGVDTQNLHLAKIRPADPPSTPVARAEQDILLTDAFLRYVAIMRPRADGRVAPGFDWGKSMVFDAVAALQRADDPDAFAALLESIEPEHPQYKALLSALSRYRAIASAGWPVIGGDQTIALERNDPRITALRRRLIAEGDLSEQADGHDMAVLEAAVRHFQDRHGLDVDGRVGRKTLAQLDLSADERVAQILVNLERWRSLPRQFPPRYVAVNAAAAMLELIENDTVVLQMRVIVGDPQHPTPVFATEARGITLNPPWNIPRSIARREILPRLRRDANYLAAHDMVIVGRAADPHGLLVDWRQISANDFPFQLRQLPGPKNALGRLKVEMPNQFDVYLHDTPNRELFRRADRWLSHGCVRLEHPAELALQLLPARAWSAETIATTIAAGQTRYIAFEQTMPVYLLYWTAFVDRHGRVNFRKDIYGRDTAQRGTRVLNHDDSNTKTASVGCQLQ